MTREEIINMLAQRIVNSKKITTMQGAVDYVLSWVDEHPINPWRDAKNDPPEVEIEVLCETNKGSRFIDKRVEESGEKRWWYAEDEICGFCDDEEITHWMPIPKTPEGGEK